MGRGRLAFWFLAWWVALSSASLPARGSAAAFVALGEQEVLRVSRLCSQHFARAEKKHRIPRHLLMAIARSESGRLHQGVGRIVPWPWTLNVAGSGRYFPSQREAVAALRQEQQQGTENIDVGCMQVNLQYHPEAFASLSQAVQPTYNVDYAARFLRANYDRLGSWGEAIAAYHSNTPARGARYLKRVRAHWKQAIARLGGTPLAQSGYLDDAWRDRRARRDTTLHISVKNGGEKRSYSLKDENKAGATAGEAALPRRRRKMKVITVSGDQHHDSKTRSAREAHPAVTVTRGSKRTPEILTYRRDTGAKRTRRATKATNVTYVRQVASRETEAEETEVAPAAASAPASTPASAPGGAGDAVQMHRGKRPEIAPNFIFGR